MSAESFTPAGKWAVVLAAFLLAAGCSAGKPVVRDPAEAKLEQARQDWQEEKNRYEKLLEQRLQVIEEKAAGLQRTLVESSRKGEREQALEKLNLLYGKRDEVKEKITTLKAAEIVQWSHAKEEVENFLDPLDSFLSGVADFLGVSS